MPKSANTKSKYSDSQIANIKVLPHSIEAEQSVLGGLMLDNLAWDKIVDRIGEHDFYKREHKIIFKVMAELSRRNHPFDVITLAAELKNLNELENIGGEVYLFEMARNTPTAANILAYTDIVRERSIMRQLISGVNEIADMAFNTEGLNSKEILDKAETKIFNIADQKMRGEGPQDISTLVAAATKRIDELYHSDQDIIGLPTGFKDLDELTSGMQDGDLIIVAGRPSMGKTSFAMNIAEHAVIKSKKPTLIFSMEMPGEALAMRILASLSSINQHKVRTGKLEKEDWPSLHSTVAMLSEAPMFIDDTPGISPAELRARARRLARTQGQLGLIVVDYLQLMQIPGYRENRTTEISEVSRTLKALAKELRVPVIALSQLNRGLEQRNDKRPVMSDLRESGAIEQDADVILFIYRDEVYNENSPEKGAAEIIVAKQRNGPIGRIKLTFLGQFTRFENYASNEYI
jgi:replicative DNA helicase